MFLAPLPLALLGMLSIAVTMPSVNGQNGELGTPYNDQVCPTKDVGVCCYILQSCSGSSQQDTSCDNAANGVANLASLGGTNNGNVPVGRSGCSNGNCLLDHPGCSCMHSM